MTDTSTDFVTPVALVAVTLRTNVPTEGDPPAATVSVVVAEVLGSPGIVTSVGNRLGVTLVGAPPTHAVARCPGSVMPFVDFSTIVDDWSDPGPTVSGDMTAEIV
jgi:hypothetical protein